MSMKLIKINFLVIDNKNKQQHKCLKTFTFIISTDNMNLQRVICFKNLIFFF